MKVGIIQSNFLPWRGYFDFIREVDLFIIEDDLQYTKGDWRNRNKIKTPRGAEWITVPVNYKRTGQLIEQTQIDYSTPWAKKMMNRIRESYRSAPCFEPYFSEHLARMFGRACTTPHFIYLRTKHFSMMVPFTTSSHIISVSRCHCMTSWT